MSLIEIVAVITTALGVWLQARRSLLNFPLNLMGVALYLWVFFDAKLYSDMLLQCFFAATLIYGWVQWSQGTISDGTIAVVVLPRRELMLGLIGGSIGIVCLGYPMAHYTNAAAPWLDATLTSYSLVANFWLARCYIENWWLWIALDVVYVGLYAVKGLYPTAALYAGLLILCCYALLQWRRAVFQQRVESSQPTPELPQRPVEEAQP
jgi:nicotinamide mononucleotide transporter